MSFFSAFWSSLVGEHRPPITWCYVGQHAMMAARFMNLKHAITLRRLEACHHAHRILARWGFCLLGLKARLLCCLGPNSQYSFETADSSLGWSSPRAAAVNPRFATLPSVCSLSFRAPASRFSCHIARAPTAVPLEYSLSLSLSLSLVVLPCPALSLSSGDDCAAALRQVPRSPSSALRRRRAPTRYAHPLSSVLAVRNRAPIP
jgi:hypothetical protein